MYRYPAPGGRRSGCLRLVLALMMVVMALVAFFASKSFNPVTGEDQYVSLTPHQEIALGLQAAPELIRQYGGEVPDEQAQAYIKQVGENLVNNSLAKDTGWQFAFHLLNDAQTINAFALPGGQVFITLGLFNRLESEGQLASVLAHEIVHVLARHGAQRIAQEQLTEGLTGAVVVASGDATAGQIAAVVGQLVNMRYGREDELQSDALGVKIMAQADYDPRAMVRVMEILQEDSGTTPPEFFSTHPNPENRIAKIEQAISELFPNGVPAGLKS
jgi:predicted Zn-dependent protease